MGRPGHPSGVLTSQKKPAGQLDLIERAFYGQEVELVGRWWNGQLSRGTRRDIWLREGQVWRVEARQGDGHSQIWTHDYPTEDDARAAIEAMIERSGGTSEWTQLATEPDPNRPATG
jgi:hypothetical protein